MPRLVFNSYCDIFKGPGTATPGLFVGTFACRYVTEDGIHAIGPGCPQIPAYLTIQGYQPQGAWTSPWFGMDSGLCDRIAIPSGQSPRFWTLYTDVIIWKAQAAYYRAYLVYLPAPNPGPGGGIVWNGSAIVVAVHPIAGSGGIVWNGSATVSALHPEIGVGGILWNGDPSGTLTRKRYIYGYQGILWDGSASWTFTPGTTYYWRDTFTGSNGTALTSHTGEYTPGGYTNINGSYYLQSNQLAVDTNPSGYTQASFDAGHTAYTWTCDFTIASTFYDGGDRYVVWYFRYANASNCCYVLIHVAAGSNSASGFSVAKVVSGVTTPLGTGTTTVNTATQYTMTLVLTTTNISVTINGVNVNVSESANASSTPTVLQFNLSVPNVLWPVFDNNIIVP